MDLGKSKLKSAGASILEQVDSNPSKEYGKRSIAGDSSIVEFSSVSALQKKGLKGQSHSVIMKDLDRRKHLPSGIAPHKATISCL